MQHFPSSVSSAAQSQYPTLVHTPGKFQRKHFSPLSPQLWLTQFALTLTYRQNLRRTSGRIQTMTVERLQITSREQWLAWRQQEVTASDVAAVLGLSPYRTIAKVWAEKTGLIAPDPTTEFLQYRLSLEAAAIDWLTRKRPNWDIR